MACGLSRLGYAFNRCNFLSFCLKPLQVKCFAYLLKEKDIVSVLFTGFGEISAVDVQTHFKPLETFQWTNFRS